MGHFLNRRRGPGFARHTHVPTAEEQILSGGPAFVCDVGLTGPHAGSLGRRTDRVLHVAVTFLPAPFEVATGDVRLGGAIVDLDPATGRATAVERLMLTEAGLAELAGTPP